MKQLLIILYLLSIGILCAQDTKETIPELPDLVIGSEQAQVTLIEYSSINCGYCGYFHNEMFAHIYNKFIKTGKIRYIYRHFPIDFQAVQAMVIIAKQPPEQWYNLITKAYKHQEEWVMEENLTQFTQILGLNHIKDIAKYKDCEETKALVGAKRYNAEQHMQIEATPIFILEYKENGTEKQKMIDDELPSLENMIKTINYALYDPAKLQKKKGICAFFQRLFK